MSTQHPDDLPEHNPGTSANSPAGIEGFGIPGMPSGGMPDMSGMLAQVQAMQSQLVQAQQELAEAQITGSSGGGLVTATVSGTGELLDLTIASEACDPQDTESLADLVVAAVRDANRQQQAVAAAKMGPLAGGLGGLGF